MNLLCIGKIEDYPRVIEEQFTFKIPLILKTPFVSILSEKRILVYGKIDSIQLFLRKDIEKHQKEFSFLHYWSRSSYFTSDV